MCLNKKTVFPRLTISEKKVYKIFYKTYLGGLFTPYYNGGPYDTGDLIFASIHPLGALLKSEVNGEGVHAFLDKCKAIDHLTYDFYIRPNYSCYVVAECFIPKNTLYYVGRNGDISVGKLRIGEIVYTPIVKKYKSHNHPHDGQCETVTYPFPVNL